MPNSVGQFMSSPGPSAYTISFGRADWNSKTMCKSSSRYLGGEDRLFRILLSGPSQNLRHVTSTDLSRSNPGPEPSQRQTERHTPSEDQSSGPHFSDTSSQSSRAFWP